MVKYGVFFLLLLCAACGADLPPGAGPAGVPRVMRSVLDQRPRMITLALHREACAAYDLEHCALYKLWKGGVHWDGAAFNNVKTVQPETWGRPYLENDPAHAPWQLTRKGKALNIRPQFAGYRLNGPSITLQYRFPLDGTQGLSVTESPEARLSADGRVMFTRTFRVEGAPPDLTLSYEGQPLRPSGATMLTAAFDRLPDMPAPARRFSDNKAMLWLDRSGCNTCHQLEEKTTGPAYRQIARAYADEPETVDRLAAKVKQGGTGAWGTSVMPPHPALAEADLRDMVRFILSLKPEKEDPAPQAQANSTDAIKPLSRKPGFGAPVSGLHPALTLQTIRPAWFRPRVGGMDFLPDGTLLVATWDSIGAVYALKGVNAGDTSRIRITRIAEGLAEPLGLKVVGDGIFVMQKNELTRLIDHDGDGITDEYLAVCNSFGVTADFHEYAYGPEYKDGYFYVALGLAMRLMDHELNHPDRGTVLKVEPDGRFEKMVTGLRQPNGIGLGPEGDLFVTENQGNWVPACKLVHIRKGDFHGCRMNSGNRFDGMEAAPPAVWLPQDEIGNSPSQPVLINKGLYKGQMLHGEVTQGAIHRTFLEKVGGEWQGCAFRFTQGLEAGINRLAWGPDGALYAGGVGINGNWAWNDAQYGLQKLVFTGRVAFEMLSVRVVPGGVEIEFTEPLARGQGERPEDYFLQQWRYEPTAAYGGPKLDLRDLKAQKVALSADRKRVRLTIPDLKEKHVLYLLLNQDLRSNRGHSLWSGEAWYTMNRLLPLRDTVISGQ